MTLVAHLTPGRTHGCARHWTMRVQENGETHNVVIIGKHGSECWELDSGPTALSRRSAKRIRARLQSHARIVRRRTPGFASRDAWARGEVQEAQRKRFQCPVPGAIYVPNPYIDPKGYLTELNIEETAFNIELENQKKSGGGATRLRRW